MFNNHSMSVITDLNLIADQINNIDFITVAAITSEGNYPNHPNIYNAGILMPSTELLMEWADGNVQVLYYHYPQYLLSKDPDDMIIALIAAMTKKNIILYIPNDEFQVYGMLLLNHLAFTYGITCNFMNTQFFINQSKIGYIISKFYLNDFIDAEQYLEMYPGNQQLPDFVINKLALELHPYHYPVDFMTYAKYFNEVNARKMQNINLVPMVEVK